MLDSEQLHQTEHICVVSCLHHTVAHHVAHAVDGLIGEPSCTFRLHMHPPTEQGSSTLLSLVDRGRVMV